MGRPTQSLRAAFLQTVLLGSNCLWTIPVSRGPSRPQWTGGELNSRHTDFQSAPGLTTIRASGFVEVRITYPYLRWPELAVVAGCYRTIYPVSGYRRIIVPDEKTALVARARICLQPPPGAASIGAMEGLLCLLAIVWFWSAIAAAIGKSGKKRPTACMMAGLTGHIWSFEELFTAVLGPK